MVKAYNSQEKPYQPYHDSFNDVADVYNLPFRMSVLPVFLLILLLPGHHPPVFPAEILSPDGS